MTSERWIHQQPNLEKVLPAFDALVELRDVFAGDVRRCMAEIKKDPDSQFWRRTSIRTLLACLEARMHALKGFLVVLNEFFPAALSKTQHEVLTKDWGIPTIQTIKVGLTILGRIAFDENIPVPAEKHWIALDQAIRLRHRITHPRGPTDLDISNVEFGNFLIAFKDVTGSEDELLKALSDAFPKRANHLKTYRRKSDIGRNDPCLCGSGKKFKQCCGRISSPD